MRVLDLFSGIGGFSLGLERAGMKTVAFCEIDEYARKVLKKHWPDVPIDRDITKRDFFSGEADVICGGFPCQDISDAGKRTGLAGQRSGLWRELVRAIRLVRPLYALVENVAALLGRGMATVLGDLAAIGYDAEWHCIPASAVGAPHPRDRIWIVAHPRVSRLSRIHEAGGRKHMQSVAPTLRRDWTPEPEMDRVANGIPRRLVLDEIRVIGNAVVPQIPEAIGRAIMARND